MGWVGWGSGGFPGASLLGMYGLFLHYGSLVVILLDNFVLSPVKPHDIYLCSDCGKEMELLIHDCLSLFRYAFSELDGSQTPDRTDLL